MWVEGLCAQRDARSRTFPLCDQAMARMAELVGNIILRRRTRRSPALLLHHAALGKLRARRSGDLLVDCLLEAPTTALAAFFCGRAP